MASFKKITSRPSQKAGSGTHGKPQKKASVAKKSSASLPSSAEISSFLQQRQRPPTHPMKASPSARSICIESLLSPMPMPAPFDFGSSNEQLFAMDKSNRKRTGVDAHLNVLDTAITLLARRNAETSRNTKASKKKGRTCQVENGRNQ